MRVLFHQLFQPESWKLYRNLGVFSFTFAPVDHPLTVLRVFHALAGTKRVPARGLLYRQLRPVELFAARSEELGDVVDGVVFRSGISTAFGLGAGARALPAGSIRHAL